MAAPAKVLALHDGDRDELERRLRSHTTPARDARRARIVLLAAEGRPALEIAELVGVSEPTVTKWRAAYAQRGLTGLEEAERSGRPGSWTSRSSARCCGTPCWLRPRSWG